MSDEALILPVHREISIVENAEQAVTRPEPTAAEQSTSDGVFSDGANQAAAALLAAQMGLGLLHNLAADAIKKPETPRIPPRKLPEEGER